MCNFYGPNAAAVTVAPAAGETGIDIVYPDIQTSEPATMASMYTLETSTPQYDNAECVSCYLHDWNLQVWYKVVGIIEHLEPVYKRLVPTVFSNIS